MCALHAMVVLYEKQFQLAALRSTEPERMGVTNLSTSVTPTGWIHVSIDPPEVETSLQNGNMASSDSPPSTFFASSVSSGSAGSEERFLDSLPRRGSSSQMFVPSSATSSLSGAGAGPGIKSVYTQVWKGLIFLASDPCMQIAEMAQQIVHGVHDRVRQQTLVKIIHI